MAKETTTTIQFTPLGHGVEGHSDGKYLMLRIPVDPAARKALALSSTGKSLSVASTGGFKEGIPGTDVRVSLNVIASIPVERAEEAAKRQAQVAAVQAAGRAV